MGSDARFLGGLALAILALAGSAGIGVLLGSKSARAPLAGVAREPHPTLERGPAGEPAAPEASSVPAPLAPASPAAVESEPERALPAVAASATAEDDLHLRYAYDHYFHGEDHLAGDRLALVRDRRRDDVRRLDACIASPFRKPSGGIEGRAGRFHVGTDIGADPDRPDRLAFDAIGSLLERAWTEFTFAFGLPADETLVPRVFVFARRTDFLEFAKRIGPPPYACSGFYDPALGTVVIDGSDRASRGEIVIHEAFHQFIAQRLRAPAWFDEGHAEYFAPSRPWVGQEGLRLGLVHAENLDRIQAAIAAEVGWCERPTPLRDLVVLDYHAFHARERLHYAQSWAFVHFLRHGFPEGGRMLARYVDALRSGAHPLSARDAAFGNVRWPVLEEEWRAYVRRL